MLRRGGGKRDLSLLLQLQQFLGGIGSIHINSSRNIVNYSVDSNKDLINLINHFEKYPLLTQGSAAADFILFKQVVELINNKAHLSIEGLHQIINIKASMNLGLSDLLKSEFNEFTPVDRPVINTENIPDPNWIAGFVTGEGSFDVNITQSNHKIGYRIQLRFRITQHDAEPTPALRSAPPPLPLPPPLWGCAPQRRGGGKGCFAPLRSRGGVVLRSGARKIKSGMNTGRNITNI